MLPCVCLCACLFCLAMEVLIEYVNTDPGSISTILDTGLPGVVFNAILVQEVSCHLVKAVFVMGLH